MSTFSFFANIQHEKKQLIERCLKSVSAPISFAIEQIKYENNEKKKTYESYKQ